MVSEVLHGKTPSCLPSGSNLGCGPLIKLSDDSETEGVGKGVVGNEKLEGVEIQLSRGTLSFEED